jgi:hypothetical protein
MAHCGQCDSLFPLSTSRRRYRLVPGQVAAMAGAAAGDGLVSMTPAGPVVSRQAALEPLLAILFATSGASSGYYLSMVQNADTVNWTAGGCSAGLLLGWIVIRWMANRT